jgi:hypothetical protein
MPMPQLATNSYRELDAARIGGEISGIKRIDTTPATDSNTDDAAQITWDTMWIPKIRWSVNR